MAHPAIPRFDAMAPTGVVLYPKPTGVTSHDVVQRVRRELRERTGERVKVGHAGTLDPFATGLLLILIGQATRTQRYLLGLPKTYRTLARLGWTSTTGDRDGVLEHTGRVGVDPQIPVGEQLQRPPAYSAVKVEGERLYERARRGDPVEGAPRPVEVFAATRLSLSADHAAFEIECSSGTYVRQLVADLSDAYCEQLERTAIGPFLLAEADSGRIIPLDRALAFMPAVELTAEEAGRAGNGVAPRAAGNEDGPARLVHAGELIAIGEPRSGDLRPVVVFRG